MFLNSFHESLIYIKHQKLQVPPIHAAIVGSDVNAQSKFESELRAFVESKKIQGHVHFVNKTLAVAPYLAAIDVLVQNSQVNHFYLLPLLTLQISGCHLRSFAPMHIQYLLSIYFLRIHV